MAADFKVVFWGVRGSRPVPGPRTVRFGGNTPSVEIKIGERLLILDAGTGICSLGDTLINKKKEIKGDIFITHPHWDHIQGFPFFLPAFKGGNSFNIYGQSKGDKSFSMIMSSLMDYPNFPVQLEEMKARTCFIEIGEDERIDLGDGITISTCSTNHPGGCISYRINYRNKSCAYITDTEHRQEIDADLAQFIEKSDLVIYDANFTDQEYQGKGKLPDRRGWGHSTWQEGIRLVKAAKAKKLALFHHAIFRTDDQLEKIEKKARNKYPQAFTAREGMEILL